jgi:hypothetical protein
MYSCEFFAVITGIPSDPASGWDWLVAGLLVLGILMAMGSVLMVLYASDDLIGKLVRIGPTQIGREKYILNAPFLAIIFLGGLFCICLSIYVSEPSRLVAASNKQLNDLETKNTELATELNIAKEQLEAEKRLTVRLDMVMPASVDMVNVVPTSLICEYQLADGGPPIKVPAENGKGGSDVQCRIENVLASDAIQWINIEQPTTIGSGTKRPPVLGSAENIYPANPIILSH